jgi:hypothetical protein
MPSAVVKTLTKRELRDLWRTPPELFARAAQCYGPFDLDAAATTEVRWFHEWVVEPKYGSVRPGVVLYFPTGRVRFLRPDGTPAGMPNFGSVLITFLAQFGTVASLVIPPKRLKLGKAR